MALARSPEALRAELHALDERSLRRRRATVTAGEAPHPTQLLIDGQRVVNFCSNDYLGLAAEPALIAAMCAAAQRCGAGSGASHLVTGHGTEHAALELELAEFTQRQRALLFSTGYMANLGVISSLIGRDDLLLGDWLNHASLIDAGALARAERQRYPHADADSARQMLAAARGAAPERGVLLATDGVFSMDGDLAPLPALAVAAREHGAWMLVDDAHGIGVLGATGRGTLEHFGLGAADVPLLIGTLGKALGSFGAFVAGDEDLIELILQRARAYIYTTALPQPVAAASRAALRCVQSQPWRREKLHALVARFRERANARGVELGASTSPIQPIIVGDEQRALAISGALRAAGFWVTAIRPPTVPRGSARLRVTLSAAHADFEVDALVDALAGALE